MARPSMSTTGKRCTATIAGSGLLFPPPDGIILRVGDAAVALLFLLAVAVVAGWTAARLRRSRVVAGAARGRSDRERNEAATLRETSSGPERTVEELRAELERFGEHRVRFVRGLAHDINNPLGAADGQAALLEARVLGRLTEEQRAAVQRIRASIASAAALIDDVVELTRAEAGELSVHRVPVRLPGLVAETVEEHRAAAEAEGLELTLEAADPIPPVRTDPTRVQQILGRLLTNAIEHTPTGGRVTVRVRDAGADAGEPPGRVVFVDVVDTGPAIPADRFDAVFDAFIRTGGHDRGGGVGLAIGRALARALGGELTATGEAGHGPTFSLRLPADRNA